LKLQVEVEVHHCNALLRRVRDFAQIKGNGTIDIAIAKYAFEAANEKRTKTPTTFCHGRRTG
jgi:hypothetical protein